MAIGKRGAVVQRGSGSGPGRRLPESGRNRRKAFVEERMTYRISYDRHIVAKAAATHRRAAEIEEYGTEREALRRARDLLDNGEHHAVLVSDGDGNSLAGVRLQLRL